MSYEKCKTEDCELPATYVSGFCPMCEIVDLRSKLKSALESDKETIEMYRRCRDRADRYSLKAKKLEAVLHDITDPLPEIPEGYGKNLNITVLVSVGTLEKARNLFKEDP